MNIKKAQDILKRWLGNRPSDQYVSYQALDSIIAALDSPIEHQHIWVKSNCAGIVCMTCGITQKEAECPGFVSMEEYNELKNIHREEITRITKMIEEYKSRLRVEGYRIEVKDAKINHLKTVLKVNGIKWVDNDTPNG